MSDTTELPRILRKKADVLAFCEARPDWLLEHCLGVSHSWYWLRPAEGKHFDTVKVDKRALPFVFFKERFVGVEKLSSWRTSVYRFRPLSKTAKAA